MAKKKKITNSQEYIFTYEHKAKLEKELYNLKVSARKKVAREIKGARLSGGTSNNKLYDNAKDEQRKIEARISKIEEILNNSKIIYEDIMLDKIVVGCKVELYDLEYDEYMDCSIVNVAEANSLKNKISDESPLGKALLGKKEGETVSVNIGADVIHYRILKIKGIKGKYIKNAIEEKTNKVEIIDISPKSFITRVNVYGCVNKKHKLVDIRCRVKIITREGKVEEDIVPGAYCEVCDKYFLLENEFQRLRQKGILVCKIVEKDYWLSSENENGYMNLNKESLLYIMGYNVNAQIDLSKMQRWGLLEIIVDENILTVSEILSHLQWLIKRSTNNPNYKEARFKWEMDYNHISNYKSSSKTVIDVKDIKRVNYKNK